MSTRLHLVVDRIEGDVAVIEVAGQRVHWPVEALPPGAAEGSSISAVFTLHEPDLSSARERVQRLARRTIDQDDDIDL